MPESLDVPPSLTQPVSDFVEQLGHTRSEHTMRAYEGDLSALAGFVAGRGQSQWHQVRLPDLRAWLGQMRRAGAAPTTLQRRSAATRVFFRWLRREQLVEVDVAATLASPKVPRRLPPDLSTQDLDTVFRAAVNRAQDPDAGPLGVRDIAMLEVLYGSGIRVAELCGLDWDLSLIHI